MESHVLSGSEPCERVIEHRREKNVILNEKIAGAIRIIKNERLFSDFGTFSHYSHEAPAGPAQHRFL